MYLIGKIILKILALLYFAMSIIGFLGYFKLQSFCTDIFGFFYVLLGKYSVVLPIICLLLALVCWKISKPNRDRDAYYEDEEFEDEDLDDEELEQNNSWERYRNNMKKSRRNTGNIRDRVYSRPDAPEINGFPAYFARQLVVKEDRHYDASYDKLGDSFPTYFGEGKRSVFLPNKTVSLQGFRDYFRNSDRAYQSRHKAAAKDTARRETGYNNSNPVSNRQTRYAEDSYKKDIDEPSFGRRVAPPKPEQDWRKTNYQKKSSGQRWVLPEYSLLNSPGRTPNNKNEQHNPKIIENVLSSFGVTAKVVNITVGPVITRYELSPAPGTKISKIVNLTDDIALALASREIRIEAPIPGKAAIGIEIPRYNPSTVYFREVIESDKFDKNQGKLKVALGKDIADMPVVAELDKMPHLLVAGATGSGKSIFINCLINSLLYSVTPEEVKLLLIDPKVVELNQYNGIPHLLAPVVTDPKKANLYLKHIVKEMENRYELFAAGGVRDIEHYNNNNNMTQKIPYIVVIIDELADLMMVAASDIEESICRLAQMARAAGIHLVIATQRPSVNVITGLIKANIPSRISFAVSSQIDSRTILDTAGAEKLLGKGDMLYSPIGLSKPVRVHGCYIDEQEVLNVVRHWQKLGSPENIIKEEELEEISFTRNDDEYDDRFIEAGELVITTGVASVSFLQRRLRVGYSRAARLMDMLEEAGVVGSYEGNKPRDILMSLEAFSNKHCS